MEICCCKTVRGASLLNIISSDTDHMRKSVQYTGWLIDNRPMSTDVMDYNQNEVSVLRQKVDAVLCVAMVESSGDESPKPLILDIGKGIGSKSKESSL
mmetsp:Transcript_46694/g.87286  ORF Transcript_46694/g.87286 Transcript_46694/m.87286 type:complete len:98 (-) Transcript_46694:512-805(-)